MSNDEELENQLNRLDNIEMRGLYRAVWHVLSFAYEVPDDNPNKRRILQEAVRSALYSLGYNFPEPR